jgi:hypothetical protein
MCDVPDESSILSPCLQGCDKVQISSDKTRFSAKLPYLEWVLEYSSIGESRHNNNNNHPAPTPTVAAPLPL